MNAQTGHRQGVPVEAKDGEQLVLGLLLLMHKVADAQIGHQQGRASRG